MEYFVKVKALNPNVEEEVIVEVNNIDLICFSPFGLPCLEIGKKYKADIGITSLDDLNMREVEEGTVGIKQVGATFAYCISGRFNLDSRTLSSDIDIAFEEDEFDLHEYGYLDGKNVEIKVDRIKIVFVE